MTQTTNAPVDETSPTSAYPWTVKAQWMRQDPKAFDLRKSAAFKAAPGQKQVRAVRCGFESGLPVINPSGG
jgi:hypothetical protein